MSGKSKYRNLILIGNGFDRWQGLPTSYESFRQYYYKNIDRILKKMHVKPIASADGESRLSPVELIYGNAFRPEKLDDVFSGTLKTLLH